MTDRKRRHIIISILAVVFFVILVVRHVLLRKMAYADGLAGGQYPYKNTFFWLFVLYYPLVVVLLIAILAQLIELCQRLSPSGISRRNVVLSVLLMVFFVGCFLGEHKVGKPSIQCHFEGITVWAAQEVDVQEVRDWFDSAESEAMKEYLDKNMEIFLAEMFGNLVRYDQEKLPDWVKNMNVTPSKISGWSERICFVWTGLFFSHGIEVLAKDKDSVHVDDRYIKRLDDGIYIGYFSR
ncbi:MAG: hypothetical protein GY869_28045 [Planctomycetes bacterium]|nr:hypothetical protein [Planctomycetota bacterium]